MFKNITCTQVSSNTLKGKTHANKDREVQTSCPCEVQQSCWQETEEQVGKSAGPAEIEGTRERGEWKNRRLEPWERLCEKEKGNRHVSI